MSEKAVSIREGSNRKSFRLKIEILESAADSGIIPEDIRSIKRLKDLAAWKDKERGITSWTSNNVHSKCGHNPDLAQRWNNVVKRIGLIVSRSKSTKTPRELRSQATLYKSENKVLMVQNEGLLVAHEEDQRNLRLALRDLSMANKRLQDAGLRPVAVSFKVR